jgi:hypothetical protein
VRKLVKAAFVVGGALAPVVLAASPAMAVNTLVGLNTGGSGPYKVVSQCNAVVGATTSLNSITYVVDATATATATKAAAAVGTSVACRIVGSNGVTYGGASGGDPGAEAVGVGTASVPTNITAHVVVCATAVYSDGGAASTC